MSAIWWLHLVLHVCCCVSSPVQGVMAAAVRFSRPVQRRRGGGSGQRQHGEREPPGQRVPAARRLGALLAGALRRQGGGGGEEQRGAGGDHLRLLCRHGHQNLNTQATLHEGSGE